MKRFRRMSRTRLLAGSLLLAGVMALSACAWFGDDAAPTGPATGPLDVSAVTNFYASRPVIETEGYGVYSQKELIVVQVPEAGDYLLVYQTDASIAAAAFRAAEPALAYIGLNEGEEVSNAWILAGTISAIPADAWTSGAVTLCAWPGSQTFALDIFESPAFDLIQQEYRTFVEAQE